MTEQEQAFIEHIEFCIDYNISIKTELYEDYLRLIEKREEEQNHVNQNQT